MGVKDLWNILSPVGEKKSLYDLQDKKVAVDLSCWVCESQSINDNHVTTQPRMYLRNLFFRTSYLLMLNVNPVFVLEGTPVDLKHDEIQKRNKSRFGKNSSKKVTRQRFSGVLKNCQQMLGICGLECVQSQHEAEATCAQLNFEKVVDGVITQDSDVFLYGAETVYRNFTISGGGEMELFSLTNIENKLNLTRDKLIVMSLLCGCDYDQCGVTGVGKETAFKYLNMYTGDDILDRVRSWRNSKDLEEKERCKKCGHLGNMRQHGKTGCVECRTTDQCLTDRTTPEERLLNNLEVSIRKKASANENFPNEEIILEYLNHSQNVDQTSVNLTWMRPNIIKFIHFANKMLDWELSYSLEKIFPLLARWQVKNNNYEVAQPLKVSKKRKVKSVDCYEILWEMVNETMLSFILDEEKKDLISLEPCALVEDKLPHLIELFQLSKKKPAKKQKSKKCQQIDELVCVFDENCKVSENKENVLSYEHYLNECNSEDNDDLDISLLVENVVSRKNIFK